MATVSGSFLPEEMVELIMRQSTHVVNLVYLYRNVCRSWRSVADRVLASSPPHLLAYDEESIELFNIFTGDSRVYKIPELKNRGRQQPAVLPRIVYSCHGWLAMDFTASKCYRGRKNHAHDICLYNPFSRAQIWLPTFTIDHSLRTYDTQNINFVLSSTQKNPSSIALSVREGGGKLMFWKAGDEKWTRFDNPLVDKRMLVADIISYKGGFCAIYSCAIYSFGYIRQFELSPVPRARELPTSNVMLLNHESSYLVESLSGELLLVHRCFPPYDEFMVFKLDWEKMEWDEIRSIGDEAIFLARNQSVCVRTDESTVYRHNCIYFTLQLDVMKNPLRDAEDVGVYDMATKTTHSFPYFSNNLRHRWFNMQL